MVFFLGLGSNIFLLFLLLQFKVTGNNLLSACKLVFKISRNEKNDPEFLKGDILGMCT